MEIFDVDIDVVYIKGYCVLGMGKVVFEVLVFGFGVMGMIYNCS